MRITPACAGKSDGPAEVVTEFKDHPRVCGEKHHIKEADLYPEGSPPRVRGKADCAGLPLHRKEDHPRVCGEKSGEGIKG